jgi:phosphoribosylanthranilate isomerase
MVQVKICGITNREDALTAAEGGAHALGFIFAKSPRRIAPEQAARIIAELPPFIRTVGVFVNEEIPRIKELIAYCGLDLVQLHGEESAETCLDLMPRTIKAFRVQGEKDLQGMERYRGKVRAFLLDTFDPRKAGGTGRTFDWTWAIKAKTLGRPLILAGGLGPENVLEAIRTVRPYAVDVNSGVEERPGKKDPLLLRRLLERIQAWNQGEEEQRRNRS